MLGVLHVHITGDRGVWYQYVPAILYVTSKTVNLLHKKTKVKLWLSSKTSSHTKSVVGVVFFQV